MKEKKYLVLSIALVLLTFVGVSLAYFLTSIEGENKRVTIRTSDLRIIFTNGDAIEGTEIEPGWSVTKTFSVENKTKNEYKYNIVIEDLVNTFKTTGYLQYKITSTDGGYNMTSFEDVPKSSNATDTVLAYSVSIPSKSTQNYTITIQYPNDENVDQSIDSLNNAIVTGKLYISKGSNPTLTYAILRDNPTIKTRTDFSAPFTETTTGTLFTSTESITGITSTPVNVYYYAGNTTNNWVKFGKKEIKTECTYNGSTVLYFNGSSAVFAKNESQCLSSKICKLGDQYGVGETVTEDFCTSQGGEWTNQNAKWSTSTNNFYWRIIRTNHDGSIRLLYVGTSHDTTTGNIGKSAFNTSGNSPKYVGYKYGEDTSLNTIRNNTTDSTIKTYIDTWYQNNLTNYKKYLSTSAVYCNDRSEETEGSYTTSSTNFGFASYKRLDTNKTPTYNCSDIRDAFSVENTSAQLSYPIALMTADEVSFAGGTSGYANMSTPYAWFISNSSETQVSSSWWSLSPFAWDGYNTFELYWSFDNARLDSHYVDSANAVRPVISLSSCVKVTGHGTADDPYVVDYENSCK